MSPAFLWLTSANSGSGGFVRLGRGSAPAPPPAGWTDSFVHRTTKPTSSNVGVGVYQARSVPTQDAQGHTGVTWNSSSKEYTVSAGTVVEDRVFNGFVNLSDGSELVNCLVRGPATEVTNTRALVQGPSTSGQATIQFCTVDPQTASAHYDGIGRGIFARRCHILNVTDCVRAFSTSANGARIRVEDSLLERMTQFAPDYVNTREETHNDIIQFQGNPNGNDNDIVLDGCALNARHSLTKGDIPPYRDEIAAVMVTPQSSVGASHGTVTWCWLEGGIYCVNAGSDSALMSSSSLVLTNCRFEKPGSNTYGDNRAPTWAIGADNSLTLTASGNTYIQDGTAVPVTPA